ncbi:hypothetical protein B0T24DRAFT_226416 [Lasiosphaeria ovina]|uniref:Uncharacterized protein n=1 Tax=Lasiosphaeria ovina TaxID=92902 RepID=A0AAE0KH78_9PEZI|nr:hypothetical protein B0T24DRAFT_226416 [Lasiosphaeria ovina]
MDASIACIYCLHPLLASIACLLAWALGLTHGLTGIDCQCLRLHWSGLGQWQWQWQRPSTSDELLLLDGCYNSHAININTPEDEVRGDLGGLKRELGPVRWTNEQNKQKRHGLIPPYLLPVTTTHSYILTILPLCSPCSSSGLSLASDTIRLPRSRMTRSPPLPSPT